MSTDPYVTMYSMNNLTTKYRLTASPEKASFRDIKSSTVNSVKMITF